MAGTYIKNDVVYKAFSDWLDNSIKLKGESHPLTTHVSSFVEPKLYKEELLEHSIKIFLELVIKTLEKNYINELIPVLVVPLGCSKNLSFWDSSISLSNQVGEEHPSIYLFEREKLKYLERTEEYKTPVNLDIPKVEGVEFNIYYRCFRDLVAIENNWEFNKALYIECYPDQHLF